MKNNRITDAYTPEQLAEIKDAAYKVADAYWAFKELADDMARQGKWKGQGDLAGIAEAIRERLTGEEGCLKGFLNVL